MPCITRLRRALLVAGTAPLAVAVTGNAAEDSASLPGGVGLGTSEEGITEYRLTNGLRLLLLPENTELERKIALLTTEEVSAAFRRNIDPAKLSFFKAGDMAKISGTQK